MRMPGLRVLLMIGGCSPACATAGTDPTAIVGFCQLGYGHSAFAGGLRTDSVRPVVCLPLTPSCFVPVTLPQRVSRLLSHHVDKPRAHKDAGLVTVTHDWRGTEFDWGQTLGGKPLHIRYSEDPPDLAFLAIPYRGHWCYIADNDLESKSTLYAADPVVSPAGRCGQVGCPGFDDTAALTVVTGAIPADEPQ